MGEVSLKEFELNKEFDLGSATFSEQEIIDFATLLDPLDFHINKEIAEKSMFGGLITSGPHPFYIFYKTKWVPLFKDTVLAGRGVNNWRFLKPVYANMSVFCKATITEIIHDKEKGRLTITWHFDITNKEGEFFQTLDLIVLHSETSRKNKIG